jgi:hypothetical protein
MSSYLLKSFPLLALWQEFGIALPKDRSDQVSPPSRGRVYMVVALGEARLPYIRQSRVGGTSPTAAIGGARIASVGLPGCQD